MSTLEGLQDTSEMPLPKLRRLFIQLDECYHIDGSRTILGSCAPPLKQFIGLLVDPHVTEVIDILIPFTEFDYFLEKQNRFRSHDLNELDRFLYAFIDGNGNGDNGDEPRRLPQAPGGVRIRIGVHIAPGIFADAGDTSKVFCGVAQRYINAMPRLWERKRLSFLQVSRPAWPPLNVAVETTSFAR